MKLKPPQKAWLDKLDKHAQAQEKLQAREDLKSAVLTKLFRDRQDEQADLLKGAQQTVIDEKTKKTQQTQDYLERDQTQLWDKAEKSFVLATVVKRLGKDKVKPEEWDPKTGEQKHFQQYQKAGRIVDRLALQMQVEVDELDKNGDPVTYEEEDPQTKIKVTKTKRVPLFSAEEIKEELYTPLVRSGLIPETNVPDDFSATKEMVDGSFEAYATRLSKEKKKSMFDENKDLGIAVFRGMVSFSGAVQGLNAAANLPNSQLQFTASTAQGFHGIEQGFGVVANDPGATEAYATTADKAAEGWIFAQNVSDLAFDVLLEKGQALYDDFTAGPKPEEGDPIKKASGKVAGLAIAEIATAFGAAVNDYQVGMAASSAYGALVKAGDAGKAIGKQDIRAAGNVLAKGLADALIQIGPQGDPDMAKAAQKADAAFKAAVRPDEVIKSLKDGKFQEAASIIAAAGVAAAKEIQNDIGVMKVFQKQANVDGAQANAGKAVSAEFERDDSPKPTERQKADHQPDDQHAAQWVETKKGFVCMKCQAPAEDAEMFAGILERKIAKLEADQEILKWLVTLGGLGFDVAADFVAPLAMGGALLRMAKHGNEALKRYNDLTAFLENRASMLNAASAYSAPLKQFIHNSSQQFMHYTFNAAMEGMKVVAAALQMGYMTAPVGIGLTAGANMSEGIEGVLYEAKKRWDLEKAWNRYKDALENPENRKAALVAMKENPTLAKYAVAWGAVIKQDPLVGDFMLNSGLNKDSFKDPEADVDKVVEYLEARMPDDNEVVGRDYSDVGKVDLTPDAWLKAKTKGEKRMGVREQSTKPLEFLLTQWVTEYGLWKAAKDKDPEVVKKCQQILFDIGTELTKYKAYDKDGVPVQPMSDVRDRFMRQIAVRKAELDKPAKAAVGA